MEINFLIDEIDKFRSEEAIANRKTGRKISSTDMWVIEYSDQAVQNFQHIAGNWDKLRNYLRAINAYKTLAKDLQHKKFAAADALFRIASLYQENGEYERAIEAYDNLFENAPESVWKNEAIYQRAVCYRSIGKFEEASKRFKIYKNIVKEIHAEPTLNQTE